MTPVLQLAADFAGGLFRRLAAVIRRHPIKTALVLPVFVMAWVLALVPYTPGTGDLKKAKIATPSVLLSADGVVLAEFKRVNRQWVPLDKIALAVVDALIANEDHCFYRHHGIDPLRTISAAFHTLTGNLQGGSTITQQLARNLYPEEIGSAATLKRKIKEAITAFKIESVYTKNEILETYLNTVPFLFNAYGIEMAARTYFDKSAEKLDVLEAATLIGMLKGTSFYNPVLHPERALVQKLADARLKKGQDRPLLQAAFLALDPRNGAVKAWVGSRDFASEPTEEPMTLRAGLVYSKNTITAQVMRKVGPARVVELAQAMGVRQSPLDPVPWNSST